MSEQSLSYATPQAVKPISKFWLRAAMVCGALPLVAGTVIIGLWLLTFAKVLPTLGMFTIIGGVVLVGLGGIFLLVYVVQSWSRGNKAWAFRAILAAILLLVNFPACGLCIRLGECWRVTVVNQTTQPISSFTIIHPLGTRMAVATIPPGGSESIRFYPQGEGSLDFTATIGQTPATGTLSGYVTHPTPGESKEVIFNANGTQTVK